MARTGTFGKIGRFVDLRRRIHRAVSHIDDNLASEHTLKDLAEIACLSPFHFHRLYTGMVGCSPKETIRRLRLQRAVDALALHGANISQAAHVAGYGSTQAFAHACRRNLGTTPTALRADAARCGGAAFPFAFSIVRRPPIVLEALIHEGTPFEGNMLVVDAQSYARFAGRGSDEVLAVYFDDLFTPIDRPVRGALGIHCEQRHVIGDRGEIRPVDIDGGYYARIRHNGRLHAMAPHWQNFLHRTLPENGWQSRPGHVLRGFVSDRAVTPLSQSLDCIYLPVRPRR